MPKGYSRSCCIRTTRCIGTFNHLACIDDDDAEPSGCAPTMVALITSSTDSPVSFDTDGKPFVLDKVHKSAERRCNTLYKLGACVIFKSGNEQPKRVVYEGASADGPHHIIRYTDVRQTLTTSPHL